MFKVGDLVVRNPFPQGDTWDSIWEGLCKSCKRVSSAPILVTRVTEGFLYFQDLDLGVRGWAYDNFDLASPSPFPVTMEGEYAYFNSPTKQVKILTTTRPHSFAEVVSMNEFGDLLFHRSTGDPYPYKDSGYRLVPLQKAPVITQRVIYYDNGGGQHTKAQPFTKFKTVLEYTDGVLSNVTSSKV